MSSSIKSFTTEKACTYPFKPFFHVIDCKIFQNITKTWMDMVSALGNKILLLPL